MSLVYCREHDWIYDNAGCPHCLEARSLARLEALAPPTALVEPREPEPALVERTYDMPRAKECPACHRVQLMALHFCGHCGSPFEPVVQAPASPAVVERAQSQEPLPIVDGDPSDLGTAREWFVAFCEKREELKQLGKEVQQLLAAVVERAPLENLIVRWHDFSQRPIGYRVVEGYDDVCATLLKCADELEALLLAWPSSREREK